MSAARVARGATAGRRLLANADVQAFDDRAVRVSRARTAQIAEASARAIHVVGSEAQSRDTFTAARTGSAKDGSWHRAKQFLFIGSASVFGIAAQVSARRITVSINVTFGEVTLVVVEARIAWLEHAYAISPEAALLCATCAIAVAFRLAAE